MMYCEKCYKNGAEEKGQKPCPSKHFTKKEQKMKCVMCNKPTTRLTDWGYHGILRMHKKCEDYQLSLAQEVKYGNIQKEAVLEV